MSIIQKILKLKKERNAIILAHLYQLPEVQDIADFVGDSLGLSLEAKKTNADVIVFCGVHFMAETASIICPDKTVLLPEVTSGCPMADMITAHKLKKLKNKHKDATVVTYINSSAEVKAESDVICTSRNAAQIVRKINNKKIIFAPDKYLGSFVASKVPEKQIILYDGYCSVHVRIVAEEILRLKKIHAEALVLAHPECKEDILSIADQVLSTTGMLNFVKNSKNKEFIIATELGIIHKLQKENPEKTFHIASPAAVCFNMKKHSLEQVLWSLQEMKYKIKVDKNILDKAVLAINRMFLLSF